MRGQLHTISDDDVALVRGLLAVGMPQTTIGINVGIAQCNVSRIKRTKGYRPHVKPLTEEQCVNAITQRKQVVRTDSAHDVQSNAINVLLGRTNLLGRHTMILCAIGEQYTMIRPIWAAKGIGEVVASLVRENAHWKKARITAFYGDADEAGRAVPDAKLFGFLWDTTAEVVEWIERQEREANVKQQ